ncbi:MAG: DJ-1/PfpI family protein [Candidatus Brocadiales bacterium]
MPGIDGKKVVMIIANQNFRDEEFQKPKAILEGQGAKVTVASSSLNKATGMLGATADPEVLYNQIKVQDYDAVVFVGGSGATEYWDDPAAHTIARECVKDGKILAAICIAPVTLANAGVLTGKKATVWSSEIEKLKAKGVNYTGADVQEDGQIITADGPPSAEKFGGALVKALAK